MPSAEKGAEPNWRQIVKAVAVEAAKEIGKELHHTAGVKWEQGLQELANVTFQDGAAVHGLNQAQLGQEDEHRADLRGAYERGMEQAAREAVAKQQRDRAKDQSHELEN